MTSLQEIVMVMAPTLTEQGWKDANNAADPAQEKFFNRTEVRRARAFVEYRNKVMSELSEDQYKTLAVFSDWPSVVVDRGDADIQTLQDFD